MLWNLHPFLRCIPRRAVWSSPKSISTSRFSAQRLAEFIWTSKEPKCICLLYFSFKGRSGPWDIKKKKEKKWLCCTQPCHGLYLALSWERPRPLEKPRRHFPSCSFMLNASSCSLALGHSITKYCFSTRCTKSFLEAAGETGKGLNNRALFPLSGSPPNTGSNERDPRAPFASWAFSPDFPSSGERGWLRFRLG